MAHDLQPIVNKDKKREPSSDPSKADTRENLDTTFGNPESK